MLPDLLRLRATHVDLPIEGHPLLARLRLPTRLFGSMRGRELSLIHARSPMPAWIAGALAAAPPAQMARHAS